MLDGNSSSTEIDQVIVLKEKEQQTVLEAKGNLVIEIGRITLSILKLERHKKERQIELDKARSIYNIRDSELRVLRSLFWKAKNSGI